MALEVKEWLLPQHLVCRCQGFTIDSGGSCTKVAIRPKKYFENGKPCDSAKSGSQLLPMHFRTFPKDIAIDDIIKFILAESDYVRGSTTYHTGISLTKHQSRIEEALQTKIVLLSELELFALSFTYVHRHLAKDDLFASPSEDLVSAGIAKRSAQEVAMRRMGSLTHTISRKHELLEKRDFPCMMVMCGSGIVPMKVYDDGQFESLDVFLSGGRTFLGMAAALTGVQDYEEVLKMAETSDGRSVDMATSDVLGVKTDSTDQFYFNLKYPEDVLYPFGKTWKNPEGAKPGDLAHSLLKLFSRDLAQYIHLLARDRGLQKVYFCGNFVKSEFVRRQISFEMAAKDGITPPENKLEFYFVNKSGYFCNVGCLLKSCHTS